MRTMTKRWAMAAALTLAAWGCDEGAQGRVEDRGVNAPPGPESTERGFPSGEQARPIAWPIKEPSNPGFAELGGDREVGAMGGGWRVSTADPNDAPIAYFDFIHDADDPAPECTYLMGSGIDPLLKGQYGRCSNASWSAARASIDFNPTNDGSDMWTIDLATPISADEWRGRLTTHKGDKAVDVVVRRRDLAPEAIPSIPPNAVESGAL